MYTTLKQIESHSPCSGSWRTLLKALGKTRADDEAISMAFILQSNGLDDALWTLRCLEGADREIRLFAVEVAREVQHLMTDCRSLAALDVAERFANGLATSEELVAAGAAARDAARDAADEADWAADWAAADATWASAAADWGAAAAARAAAAADWATAAADWDVAAADWVAARDVAAADWVAARAAADATWASAWDAARASARTRQAEIFLKYFG